MTALKSALFFLLVALLIQGLVPAFFLNTKTPLVDPGPWRWIAIPLWLVGWPALIWCFWIFTTRGQGTPNPLDPPRQLVVTGLYRYVRNPIYIAALANLVGWSFWSPSLPMLLMPVIGFISSYLFVVFYEEPHLLGTFGSAYQDYCCKVQSWIPRFK